MSRNRCCACNGPRAICKNCRCAKNRTPCISCFPARRKLCVNVSHAEDTVRPSQSSDNSIEPRDVSAAVPSDTGISPLLKDFMAFTRASILNRIPRGSRNFAAASLNILINKACDSDDPTDWQKLFRFSSFCLKKPKRGGKRRPALAALVNKNIQHFMSAPLAPIEPKSPQRVVSSPNDEDARSRGVGEKARQW